MLDFLLKQEDWKQSCQLDTHPTKEGLKKEWSFEMQNFFSAAVCVLFSSKQQF